jgi:hypothetical protein
MVSGLRVLARKRSLYRAEGPLIFAGNRHRKGAIGQTGLCRMRTESLAGPSPHTGKLDFRRQRRRAPISFRTVFVSHRDPERAITPAQTAENRGCSAETGNSGLAQDCVVGPGGVPAANAFKGLEWQTERSAHLGAKEHFRPLANRSMPASKQAGGALRRFSSRRAQAPENSIIRRPGARCCSVWQQPATTVEPYRAPFEETSR